eukprot:6325515-Amphidinium_carterae.3
MSNKTGPRWSTVERRVAFDKATGRLIADSAVQEDPECWHASLPSDVRSIITYFVYKTDDTLSSGIGDLDKTLDYLLGPTVGLPSRHKKVCGYVVMHVDDLFIAGTTVFLDCSPLQLIFNMLGLCLGWTCT